MLGHIQQSFFSNSLIHMDLVKKEKQIDLDYQYKFPDRLTEIPYNKKIIIVANDTARYIVLNNENQLAFFRALKNMTIRKAIESRYVSDDDIRFVLIQIEAKQLENTNIVTTHRNHLQLFVTQLCNLRCPHCYMSSGEKLANELSTKEILSILDSFSKNGGRFVTFTGGEVCTRTDFIDIVKYAKYTGLHVEIFTNGTLWTKELVDNISDCIDKVQISIDGYDEESNAKIRGKGNFHKSLNAVRLFHKKGIPVRIATTPQLDDLLHNRQKYVDFTKRLLSEYPQNLRVVFTGELLDGRNGKISIANKKAYIENIEQLYIDCYGTSSDWPMINRLREGKIFDNCSFGELAISSNGNVSFCGRLPYLPSVTNVRDVKFDEIIRLSKIAKQKSNINMLKPCKDCAIKYICGGGCRIEHFPELIKSTDIEGFDVNIIKPRICNEKQKNKYYDLMIRINDKLFM